MRAAALGRARGGDGGARREARARGVGLGSQLGQKARCGVEERAGAAFGGESQRRKSAWWYWVTVRIEAVPAEDREDVDKQKEFK